MAKLYSNFKVNFFNYRACKELPQVDVPNLLAFNNPCMSNIPFCTVNSNFYSSWNDFFSEYWVAGVWLFFGCSLLFFFINIIIFNG